MKLLIDQNLSPKLANQLAGLYPGSDHVLTLGLDCSSDDAIWNFAKANDFVIVTKDADFSDLVVVRGFPPKVLWLQLGNCTTAQVADVLRDNQPAVEAFGNDPAAGTLALT